MVGRWARHACSGHRGTSPKLWHIRRCFAWQAILPGKPVRLSGLPIQHWFAFLLEGLAAHACIKIS